MDFQMVGFEQGEECFPLLKGVLETPENSCSLKYMLKVPPPSHKFDNVVPLDSTAEYVCAGKWGEVFDVSESNPRRGFLLSS